MMHVTDVLLGSENQKVLKFGHQSLSTYGIGKDLTRDQWMHVARQLIQKDLLTQDEHGSLKLTAKAYQALRNHETIMGVLDEPKEVEQVEKPVHDRDLFEMLRAKRKELADLASVPPYVIFSDRTLTEMATYFPLSAQSLSTINGVGAVKLERYGAIFLEMIQAYCAHRNISERSKESRETAPKRQTVQKLRHTEVGNAYNQGKLVKQLMDEYDVQLNTILDHLTKFAMEGNPLRPGDDFKALSKINELGQQAVMAAFAEEGVELLRPVFDRLNGGVTYQELKILRLHYLSLKQP